MARYDSFRFEYAPGVIRYGTGVARELDDELERQGFERALVVTGEDVGANPDVMNAIESGLGDRLAGVLAETTPAKLLSTAARGLERVRELEADVVVAVGGGSSLDVAKGLSVLSSRDDSAESAAAELAETGGIAVGDGDPIPIVAVPTTLAGADLSIVAGISAEADSGLVDEDVGGGLSDPALMPTAIFHDPALFATTPRDILAGSAMNGFNKGLETIYSRHATPVTDATAARGLRLMTRGLRELGEQEPTEEILETTVEGLILVQYGIAQPGRTTLSLMHAFGHTLRDGFEIQQGTAHAVITPEALRYLFEHVDGRRDLLVEALEVRDADDPTDAIVETIAEVRDGLGLPSRLRDLPNADRSLLPDIAEATIEDGFMPNRPEGFDPTADDIEELLQAAW
jgi:alcohol dehydrogenase class IV